MEEKYILKIRRKKNYHQMEIVGKELRENMIWGKDTNLDNASN